MFPKTCATLFAVALSGNALAAAEHEATHHHMHLEHEHHNHASHGHSPTFAAHQHGHGELAVALEGKALTIELITPAADILGFEHPAATSAEQQAVIQAKQKVEQPLFNTGKSCTLIKADHNLDDFLAATGFGANVLPVNTKAQHAEITFGYSYQCNEAPQKIVTEVFKSFPSLISINAQWLSDNQQGAASLNAQKNYLTLND